MSESTKMAMKRLANAGQRQLDRPQAPGIDVLSWSPIGLQWPSFSPISGCKRRPYWDRLSWLLNQLLKAA